MLEVARSSCYQNKKLGNAQNLEVMIQIDRVNLEHPYFGSRQMTRWLRLMKVMGIEAHS